MKRKSLKKKIKVVLRKGDISLNFQRTLKDAFVREFYDFRWLDNVAIRVISPFLILNDEEDVIRYRFNIKKWNAKKAQQIREKLLTGTISSFKIKLKQYV